MAMLGGLYDRVLGWAAHARARWFLGGLSFAESSFFPIPPDVMLIPMTLARPENAWRLALLTTVTSVAGGIAGYFIGVLALDWVEPLLHRAHYWENYLRVTGWFANWGFWAVLLAGFSPIPYKLFTIAAGAVGMVLPVFVVASAAGRGARFFLVAGLVKYGGAPMEARIRRHIDAVGLVTIMLFALAYLLLRG